MTSKYFQVFQGTRGYSKALEVGSLLGTLSNFANLGVLRNIQAVWSHGVAIWTSWVLGRALKTCHWADTNTLYTQVDFQLNTPHLSWWHGIDIVTGKISLVSVDEVLPAEGQAGPRRLWNRMARHRPEEQPVCGGEGDRQNESLLARCKEVRNPNGDQHSASLRP